MPHFVSLSDFFFYVIRLCTHLSRSKTCVKSTTSRDLYLVTLTIVGDSYKDMISLNSLYQFVVNSINVILQIYATIGLINHKRTLVDQNEI